MTFNFHTLVVYSAVLFRAKRRFCSAMINASPELASYGSA